MKAVLFLFGELNDLDLDWLIQNGKAQPVSSGGVLIEEGRPIGGVYIVLEGLFEVFAGQVARKRIAQMGAGEILGEACFVDSRPPTMTAQALIDSVVFAIPRECLAVKLGEDPPFAGRFYRAIGLFLAHRVRILTHKCSNGAEKHGPASGTIPTEIDEQVLARVYQGGKRFERLLRKLTFA